MWVGEEPWACFQPEKMVTLFLVSLGSARASRWSLLALLEGDPEGGNP